MFQFLFPSIYLDSVDSIRSRISQTQFKNSFINILGHIKTFIFEITVTICVSHTENRHIQEMRLVNFFHTHINLFHIFIFFFTLFVPHPFRYNNNNISLLVLIIWTSTCRDTSFILFNHNSSFTNQIFESVLCVYSFNITTSVKRCCRKDFKFFLKVYKVLSLPRESSLRISIILRK